VSYWEDYAAKYMMNTVKRMPLTVVKGKGVRVWDDTNRSYLDFVAGWAVNSLGHCHPVMVTALKRESQVLIQASNQFYTIPQLRLAELLVRQSCLQKAFFCNSGAEANEGAVKLARRYGKLHLDGAYEVITANNSFHGRTLAMVAASGQKKFQEPYSPVPAGFINVDYNSIEAIKTATRPSVCAVMLEPIQGEGGVNIPESNYLTQVRAWCDEKGLVLILDEVQTGIGRTGTLFGYEQYHVEPDVITLAKGLGGGMAIGAILAKDRVSVFSPGEHGSTYGGNPLACSVAYDVIQYVLDNNLVENARVMGKHFLEGLMGLKEKFPFVTDARGKGLLLALEFEKDVAEQVTLGCMNGGLLVNKVKPNAIRFMPPLIVGQKEIDEALGILAKVLQNL
jgi:acetylornithine/N-succinyldiaminopimelate aminotransferase